MKFIKSDSGTFVNVRSITKISPVENPNSVINLMNNHNEDPEKKVLKSYSSLVYTPNDSDGVEFKNLTPMEVMRMIGALDEHLGGMESIIYAVANHPKIDIFNSLGEVVDSVDFEMLTI